MLRPLDPERDREATHRIWREVGWHDGDDFWWMDAHIDASRALVGEVDGQAECLALSRPGTLPCLNADLPWTGRDRGLGGPAGAARSARRVSAPAAAASRLAFLAPS